MPHWTTPDPTTPGLTAEAAGAITALQNELDTFLSQDTSITAAEIDAVAGQIEQFYDQFQAQLQGLRSKLTTS